MRSIRSPAPGTNGAAPAAAHRDATSSSPTRETSRACCSRSIATQPSYFPGLALAVDDDIVVTAQNVGTEATINVFDHDAQPISSGVTTSVRAAIIGDESIHLITVDGEIVTMSTASGDTESVGRLALGSVEFGVVTTSGDRLVVVGERGSAIVDDTGAEIGNYPGVRRGSADRSPRIDVRGIGRRRRPARWHSLRSTTVRY